MEDLFKISWLGLSGISVLIFLIGIIVGHRLNIDRDKRNRLFELSGELKKYFISQTKNPSLSHDEKIIEKMDIYTNYMSGINYFYKKKSENLKIQSQDFFNHIMHAECESTTGDNFIGLIGAFWPKYPEPIIEKANAVLKLLND